MTKKELLPEGNLKANLNLAVKKLELPDANGISSSVSLHEKNYSPDSRLTETPHLVIAKKEPVTNGETTGMNGKELVITGENPATINEELAKSMEEPVVLKKSGRKRGKKSPQVKKLKICELKNEKFNINGDKDNPEEEKQISVLVQNGSSDNVEITVDKDNTVEEKPETKPSVENSKTFKKPSNTKLKYENIVPTRQSERRMSAENKPYRCNHCPLSFSTLVNKVIHERTHENEKPFKCSYCEMRFVLDISRTRHMRIHKY